MKQKEEREKDREQEGRPMKRTLGKENFNADLWVTGGKVFDHGGRQKRSSRDTSVEAWSQYNQTP